ncbi:RNA polymerase sigma-54 factor 2 [Candidatus Bealeia paramacronuclearis]|uniref:RNA polymerase sigma-54 factor n=1 Tax=Candidatus Bealeia paramacronuclearis TaxID=1921001 RepID=A0ABZ2C3V3_9PROT|nr:RNA polymerase sigma-54 factor 2 [Candidatus Bealeia paramacronuclearis]
MPLQQRLDQTQTQTLTMTPQLRLAIELLQMTNLELSQFLENELIQNPLLEHDETTKEEDQTPIDESEETLNLDDSQDHWDSLDGDENNVFQDEKSTLNNIATQDHHFDDGKEFDIEDIREKSLQDYLFEQLRIEAKTPQEHFLGALLIHKISEAGYLEDSLEAIALQMNCLQEEIESALDLIQSFDPPGIGARNLSECLRLQFEQQKSLTPLHAQFLKHLDLLGRGQLKDLQKLLNCDEDALKGLIQDIRALNPKPGATFQFEDPQTRIPDVFVRFDEKSQNWHVELNSETLPKVMMNQKYAALLKLGGTEKDTKTYLNQHFQSANWLLKAIDQRAKTILKVATQIVHHQEDFFKYGIRYLKPLVMKEIADAIEMHESTVSRVTSNKYLATPRGIFEFKFFFTTGINSSAGGDALSSEHVRMRIQNLVENEPPGKPLSDEKLVEILEGEGIEIARRTVAKYRDQLSIPPAFARKRQKVLG